MSQLKQLSKNFFCYLLTSLHPEFKNHTYIGFTSDLKNRIKQHNREKSGGARKTLKKLPWQMVLAISGFETDILALQFEWAWQRPRKSVFLKHLYPVKGVGKGQTFLKAKVRYLYLLINTPPFLTMNLTIHWFVKQKSDPTNTAQTTEKNVVTTNDIVDYNLLKVGCLEFPRETFTELDNLYDCVCRSCKLTIIEGEVNPCELQLCPSKKQRRLAKSSEEKTVDEVKIEGSDEDKVQKTKRKKIKVKVNQVKTKTKAKAKTRTSKAKSVKEPKTKSITKTKARTSKITKVDGEIKTKTKTKTKSKTKTKVGVKEKEKRKRSRTTPAKTDNDNNEGITEITEPKPQRKPRKSTTLKTTKKSKDNS